jgi:hypothetical protein
MVISGNKGRIGSDNNAGVIHADFIRRKYKTDEGVLEHSSVAALCRNLFQGSLRTL